VSTSPKILGPNGRPFRAEPPRAPQTTKRRIAARYDAAETTTDGYRHWQLADNLSARAANSPDVREKLRNRARYEAANNSYARGIVNTLANDTIGTGPRLQLLTDDADTNRALEQAFMAWSDTINLAEKLRTMRKARAVDGEGFGALIFNGRLASEVTLDIKLIEADQVATPTIDPSDDLAVDGIRYDGFGNAIEYHVLREHPGDGMSFGAFGDFERVPARKMLHWFRCDRPGQARGIPDITPALPLFAQLRRYTLAVLAAAETAADFAAVLYTENPTVEPSVDDDENAFVTTEIERRMMTTLPGGWKMAQLKAEQPATTYPDFKKEILNEIARCLDMPFNIAAGNSAGYNYSSGRLDHQTYYKSLRVDQAQAELVLLDRIFAAWLAEAFDVTDIVPEPPDRLAGWPHQWFWDGQERDDPEKEARAQETRLKNKTSSYAYEFARQGRDWETEFQQIAKEQERMRELGIEVAKTTGQPAMQPQPTGGDDGQDN
jgi:lambda family phage portal protein